MRKLLLSCLLVLGLALPNVGAAVNPMKDLAAATLPIEANGTEYRYCSAVVVAPERILTAAHCVITEVAYPAVRVDGKQLRITGWIVEDSARDLVIGIVPGLNVKPVPIGDASDVFKGQRVLVLGYPDGGPLVVTEGVMVLFVSTVCYSPLDCRQQATTTAPARGGNSGGPVVVIRDGQAHVVGILVGGVRESGQPDYSLVELLVGQQETFRR